MVLSTSNADGPGWRLRFYPIVKELVCEFVDLEHDFSAPTKKVYITSMDTLVDMGLYFRHNGHQPIKQIDRPL
jgi:hypothetical protein